MQNALASALSLVTIGSPITQGNLTMVPLLGPPAAEREPFYLTLDDAIRQASTEIVEVSEPRNLPTLRIVNQGAKPVFILDGEALPGADQNRIVNLSILVPAASTVLIPLPGSTSSGFSAAPGTLCFAGRATRMALATLSMQVNKYRADRADVWAGVSANVEGIGAMTDRWVEELRPVERQRGALFMIDGTVVGFDLFDHTLTLRQLLPKLVRSAALDALDRSGDSALKVEPQLVPRFAACFLEQAAAAPVHAATAIGEGEDIRIMHPDLAGGALAVNGSAVHVAAFAIE